MGYSITDLMRLLDRVVGTPIYLYSKAFIIIFVKQVTDVKLTLKSRIPKRTPPGIGLANKQ